MRTMRTVLAALSAALVVVPATTVSAAPPVAGCPAGPSGFGAPVAFEAFWSQRVEAYPTLDDSVRARAAALWATVDGNGDGLLCSKELPDTYGIAEYLTQLKDNTAAAR